MGKYRVLQPFSYALRTGEPSHGLGIPRKVVRANVGDVVEFDDELAATLGQRLEWYIEPQKPVRPKFRPRQPKPAEQSDSEPEADKPEIETPAESTADSSGEDSDGDQRQP